MIVLQRHDRKVLVLQCADRFQAGLGRAQGRHDRDAIGSGDAADLDGVFLCFAVVGGIHDELDLAVLHHVEDVGTTFVELGQRGERRIT